MKRSPPTLRRIFTEAAAVVLLHWAGIHLMAKLRIMEHLLSPTGATRWALGGAVVFMLLRGFTLMLLPGWVLARVWLWRTRDKER